MEKLLVLLCFLVPVSLSSGTLSRVPCPTPDCPGYELKENHENFQKRLYQNTKWLTTSVASKSLEELKAASDRLAKFCSDNNMDLTTSWPVLLTVHSNKSYSLSWFVPNNINVPKPQGDSLIQLQDEVTFEVYVSSFGGLPSLDSGLRNANELWKNLKTHLHKNCGLPTFRGVTYNHALSLTHDNEIWISVNDIC